MNLENFIAETITQIARGVERAAGNLESSSALVSPRNIKPADDKNSKIYGYLERYEKSSYQRVVEEIEFDVAVTASEGTEAKAGMGIMVGSIGIGTQGKSDTENTSVSRIKFRIPVVLPYTAKANSTEEEKE